MAEMNKLIESDSPSLKLKLSPCTKDLNRMELKMKLIEHMKYYQGIGLSANQIGVMERVFVMYSDVKKKEIIACFNPNIVAVSPKKTLMDEGCLTYPGLWLKVSRPESIEVEYEDVHGEKTKVFMYGLEARVFLHEYDHMEGKNFTDGVSKVKLDMAKKKQKKALIKAAIYKEQEEEREKQMKFGQSLIVWPQ